VLRHPGQEPVERSNGTGHEWPLVQHDAFGPGRHRGVGHFAARDHCTPGRSIVVSAVDPHGISTSGGNCRDEAEIVG
jgi:hypothetical protein